MVEIMVRGQRRRRRDDCSFWCKDGGKGTLLARAAQRGAPVRRVVVQNKAAGPLAR